MQTNATPLPAPSHKARGDNRKLYKRDRDQARKLARAFKLGAFLALAASSAHAAGLPKPGAYDAGSPVVSAIIEASAAGHPYCPCPDSLDASGKPCGQHSAYVAEGGAPAVICDADDIERIVVGARAGR